MHTYTADEIHNNWLIQISRCPSVC